MPELWWATATNALTSQGVAVSDKRFPLYVSALPADVAVRLREIILNPPDTDKCTALKDAIMDAYSLSAEQKYETLLGLKDLGDKRPSEMLSFMKSLADDDLKKSPMFAFMFRQLLPPAVRSALATATAPLDSLARQADLLVLTQRSIARAAAAPSTSAVNSTEVSVNRVTLKNGLCFVHAKYGANAYTCRSQNCKMKGQLATRPPSSGNDRAGR
jgi:hypothetical protein